MKLLPKKLVLVFIDAIIIICAYSVALLLRFDFRYSNIPNVFEEGHIKLIGVFVVVTIIIFYCRKLYHSIWSLVSMAEVQRIVSAYILLLPVYILVSALMRVRMPISYYLMGYILSFIMVVGLRFSYCLYIYYIKQHKKSLMKEQSESRIMVIGAGAAGQVLIKELSNSERLRGKVYCFIDDNQGKVGRFLAGIPIVGNRNDILDKVKEYNINHIIYAIANTSPQNRKEILNICKEAGCKLQTIPGIYQLLNGEVSVSQLRNVNIQDLLGRDQINVNNKEILNFLQGKVVLVTGGGGSIGSELCRQIAKAQVKQLIVFDIYENNAYNIQQELEKKYPDLDLEVLIGSVRNSGRINSVMEKYRPDVVFHAAAHKHVPLMENSPNEAIKNNVIGTYKAALAASKVGVKRFVLISTDKAVNPTNIMGASKRLCEMVVQMMGRRSNTEFVTVRFGNVLGSNGSVIPLFEKQIAAGGPVTVTDKNIIRYFMTIPEAVSLVLQACCYAKGGEIYILDMGEPVKIDDMARNLIRLSGFVPDVDIKIEYIGLRPGEKLYEELLMDEEGLQNTDNSLIYIGKPIEMDDELFIQKIHQLDLASEQESDRIKEMVAEIVPTYCYKK